MVKELTQEEQEIAACTSYAYWVASQQDQVPSTQVRIKMAMREARRHLVGEANVYEKGLAALRASCQYRKVSAAAAAVICDSYCALKAYTFRMHGLLLF